MSWQDCAHPPPNSSFSPGGFTYFSSIQDAVKVESKRRGDMTILVMAKWFDTPCFYTLPYPIPCSGCSVLPLALPSNSQPPARDPELPALWTPPTPALGVLSQIPLETYYQRWLVWPVGVPARHPSSLHEYVLQAAALLPLHRRLSRYLLKKHFIFMAGF